ncbi:hypothetical protein N7467_004867 [Penicillium canescens]|nr:hypothetical protein N7467_004867 [Penicillium canescens]
MRKRQVNPEGLPPRSRRLSKSSIDERAHDCFQSPSPRADASSFLERDEVCKKYFGQSHDATSANTLNRSADQHLMRCMRKSNRDRSDCEGEDGYPKS